MEANYNSSRLLGAVPAASGDDGRASPPSRGLHPIKYNPAIFNGMGRGLLAGPSISHDTCFFRSTVKAFLKRGEHVFII